MLTMIESTQTPSSLNIAGCEAFTVGERVGLFFKEVSTSIDRGMASLKSSAHVIDYSKAEQNLRKPSAMYIKNTSKPITIPRLFNPKVMAFGEYIELVTDLIKFNVELRDESKKLYVWLKAIVSSGKVPANYTHNLGFFGWGQDLRERIGKLKAIDTKQASLSQVYLSNDDIFNKMDIFNAAIKPVGSRDTEVFVKELSGVYSIGNLLSQKIAASDITLNERDMDVIDKNINQFIDAVNLAGAGMGLVNELTAVFRTQVEELKKY